MPCFPTHIHSGPFPTPHCQGIALDQAKGVMYFSYTTMLVKTDLEGNVIGTVDSLTGHLGCIAFSEDTRKIYGSLEYKNDPIGRGIHAHLGLQEDPDNAFFIAIFDGDAIDRIGMDAETDGVMKTVFLRDVWEDFEAPGHRYGCSGIDGTTIAPVPGTTGPRDHLLVAYGIYGDNDRDDNDHQVILSYPLAELERFAMPHKRLALHQSGPEKPESRYFVFTGNTEWGVQNMEYDPHTGTLLLAVYPGYKEAYPNRPLYLVDASEKPKMETLQGLSEEGLTLPLAKGGIPHQSGVTGYDFPHGSTGLYAFGDGRYYIAESKGSPDGQESDVYLYTWDGVTPFRKAGE